MAPFSSCKNSSLAAVAIKRRSMLAGQPVEVVKPPATRRGQGRGPSGPPPRKAAPWNATQLSPKNFAKNLSEKFAAVTPGNCGGRLVRVRYAPIATKFCGAPK